MDETEFLDDGEQVQIHGKEHKGYRIIERNCKYYRQCTHCQHLEPFTIKDNPLVKLMKTAGGHEWNTIQAYLEHERNDSQFSGWELTNCDICGEKRVIGFFWSYYSSGPDFCTVYPSETLRIPSNRGSGDEIHICSFCMDKSEKDKKWFNNKIASLIKLVGKKK
jgi:hypothetical protein